MNLSKLIVLFCFLLCFACEKESNSSDLSNEINFSNLQVGQQSAYIHYQSNCENTLSEFEFTGDTLLVEVIEEKGALFLKESYSPFSKRVRDGRTSNPVQYPIQTDGHKIILKERGVSRLFSFYGSDELHLKMEAILPKLFQEGCKLHLRGEPFIGDDIARLITFQVGPLQFYEKIAVSCVPMVEIDGYLIYDSRQLFMSHTIVESSFNGNTSDRISGWCLVDSF